MNKMSIDSGRFAEFMADYGYDEYKGQRLGQAFYNAFNLHKVTDQTQFANLYEKDGHEAVAIIFAVFEIA